MLTLTTNDKIQRTSAGAIAAIMLAILIGAIWPQPRITPQASAQPAVATPIILIITATPALPTAQPTIAPSPIPTDAPAPVVNADPPTPVVIFVPVEQPSVIEQPTPVPEVREVAPGIEHGIRPSQRGPNTAGPGMPEATPQP